MIETMINLKKYCIGSIICILYASQAGEAFWSIFKILVGQRSKREKQMVEFIGGEWKKYLNLSISDFFFEDWRMYRF